MSNTIRKIVKYVVIVALLGAVVFFGAKLLYPTPSKTLAYDNTLVLLKEEKFETNAEATQNFITKFNSNYEDSTKIDELSYSADVIDATLNILGKINSEFLFAKNTSVYNSKANQLQKIAVSINETLNTSITYIESQLEPNLNKTSLSNGTLEGLRTNLISNNKKIVSALTAYLENASTIFMDLENNFLTNPYSKKVVQIASVWISSQNDFLNSDDKDDRFTIEKGIKNLNALTSFFNAKYTQTKNLNYVSNKAQQNIMLQSIAKANIKGLTNAIEIYDINDFFFTISNTEIQTSTQSLYNFILEVE